MLREFNFGHLVEENNGGQPMEEKNGRIMLILCNLAHDC
jgi:hypothetical protein